ncbi:hypothetical protein AVEN_219725-1 [Araneus ventricosus]|uniref:Transposable element P transposase-like GTP-binding insertion domain-containing protein n=1 Tax=Araneus ventricosus TaxID=182803 RepID=A0A4Y2WKW0_ARAVE|nr:hypothetical protein AVEN_219725-1 [Araneus ventricosus]
MLKLVRNTFGEKRCLFSSEIIDWKYVEALHKLQESDSVHLGNKLRGGHIKFSKQKMKVKLAAQLFSSSVADAIDYCHNKLNPPSGAMEILKRLRNATFVKLSCTSKRQQFLTMNIPSPFLRLENTPMSKERHDSDLYYCGL